MIDHAGGVRQRLSRRDHSACIDQRIAPTLVQCSVPANGQAFIDSVLCGVLAALGLCVFILRRRRRRSLGALGGAPGRRGKTQPMQTPMMDPTFTTSSSYVPPPMAADFRAPPPGMNPMNVQGAP